MAVIDIRQDLRSVLIRATLCREAYDPHVRENSPAQDAMLAIIDIK